YRKRRSPLFEIFYHCSTPRNRRVVVQCRECSFPFLSKIVVFVLDDLRADGPVKAKESCYSLPAVATLANEVHFFAAVGSIEIEGNHSSSPSMRRAWSMEYA